MNPAYNEEADACQQDCSFGLVNKTVGCIPPVWDGETLPTADCLSLGRNAGGPCSTMYSATDRVDIRSRKDVVKIEPHAFAHFPGQLTMEGQFPRLVSIGSRAFLNCSWSFAAASETDSNNFDGASYLHFGSGAFPVLVGIETYAFMDFHGSIRFVGSPWPKLQYIAERAFMTHSLGDPDSPFTHGWNTLMNRKLDFLNHASLSVIDKDAFKGSAAKIILAGDLANLTYIGEDAFSSHNTQPFSAASESIVQLVDLPKLVAIGEKAFMQAEGVIELRGTFPMLEFIGSNSFDSNPGSVTIDLQGGPALRCVGARAFASTTSNTGQGGGLKFNGSFPCLNLDAGGTYNGVVTWGDDKNAGKVSLDMGLQSCKGYENSERCETPGKKCMFSCRKVDLACTARHGDDIDTPCTRGTELKVTEQSFKSYDEFIKDSVPTPKRSCRLAYVEGLSDVGCVEGDGEDEPSFCSEPRCASITANPLVVTGRDDVIAVQSNGFKDYGSKIEIHGRFNRLGKIGLFAFSNAGTTDSLIEFADGDLPVLVEVGMRAFAGFKGDVRFIGKPFPSVKWLRRRAFADILGVNSKVELVDHEALIAVEGYAFSNFPEVHLAGALPKLEMFDDNVFNCEETKRAHPDAASITSPEGKVIAVNCMRSKVDLGDAPSLRRIGKEAFFYFLGTVRLAGHLPSLEVIGRKAFEQCQRATVSIVEGAAALRCIGEDAFAYNAVTPGEDSLVLSGGFPCLSVSAEQDREVERWNNPKHWALPSAARVNINVVGECTDAFSAGQCQTLDVNVMCESRGGDRTFAPCEDEVDFANNDFIKGNEDGNRCAYGILETTSGGSTFGCIPEGDRSVCAGSKGREKCDHLRDPVTIRTNKDITMFADFGFRYLRATIKVQGYFQRLQSIGMYAFSQAGGLTSSIVFGEGSLPMLVSIDAYAFHQFGGVIRIVGGAFPSLQTINAQAFMFSDGIKGGALNDNVALNSANEKSEVTLVNQMELHSINSEAFKSFPGKLVVKGKFPKLLAIGSNAFTATAYSTEVNLVDLPKLQLIEFDAFGSFAGKVKLAGCFPSLIEIQSGAFQSSRMELHIEHGAPALHCLGSKALPSAIDLHGPRFAGSFPCINVGIASIEELAVKGKPNSGDFRIGLRDFQCTDKVDSGQLVAKEDWCRHTESKCNVDNFVGCNMSFPIPKVDGEVGPAPTLTTFSTLAPTTSKSKNATSNTGPGTDDDGSANPSDAGNSGGGVAAGIICGVLAVAGAVFAVRHRQARQERSFGQRIAEHIQSKAKDFFVANFAHLLSGFDGSRSVAADKASRWIDATALAGSRPQSQTYKVVRGDEMGKGWYGTRYFAKLRRTGKAVRTAAAPVGGAAAQEDQMPEDVVVKVCGTEIMAQQYINASDQEMLKRFCLEALLVGSLEHDAILKVLRVEMSSLPLMVVTEHMVNGSLKDYLRSVRPSAKTRRKKLKVEDLLPIGLKVVQACEFLESKKVVHRAIMAENVLVGSVGSDGDGGDSFAPQIKLSGFGSLREVLRTDEYISLSDVTKDTGLDIRWMAIESFAYNRFSVKSDVWSFAVLLWELFSFARKPYGAFNPSEIAQEVRSGRRLDPVEGCPTVLHDAMAKCWLNDEGRRPTFASLQGTMQLLMLEDADTLRASVEAATKLSAESLDWLQWAVPNKGWSTISAERSDCTLLQLETQQQAGHPPKTRLALASSTPDEAAVLKTVFSILQNLQHRNVVPLVGCNNGGGGGSFSIFFDPLSGIMGGSGGGSTAVVTLHDVLHTDAGAPTASAAPTATVQRQQSDAPGYLVIGGTAADATTDEHGTEPLHTTVNGCLDLALQMALALEYVHANQIVHGRLSSRSFYMCDAGSTLRLLVGNTLAGGNGGSDASDDGGAATSMPPNLRWLPEDILPNANASGQQPAATTATDVYSYGILLWEVFLASSGGGKPYSAKFPTDAALAAEVRQTRCMPPLSMDPLSTPALIADVYAACANMNSWDRPWISNVVSTLLDDTPGRWEKSAKLMEPVQNLGAGEFGQVVKMSTRLFSNDGSKGFVAVKMLTPTPSNNDEQDDDNAATTAAALQSDFLREVELMKQFRHPNLVQLLGVCTATKPYMMILEFLTGGSLDQWLPANGPLLLKPTAFKLIHLLHQVALGMTELGKAGIVHRDLAARNVLIDERLQVKVADYGLSRDVEEDKNYYRIHTERPIPLRWTAPEAVTVLKFTSASDVFSFAVFAFEVFTFGGFPFAATADDMRYLELLTGTLGGKKVVTAVEPLHRPLLVQISKVLAKYRVPSGAPPPLISTLLQDCLQREPERRPTFADLVHRTRIGASQKAAA